MDASTALELIAGGESLRVEFKSDQRAHFSDRDMVEALLCLANAEGGVLFIGVEDDCEITGARPRHKDGTDPARVQAVVANLTHPPLICRAQTLNVPAGKPDRRAPENNPNQPSGSNPVQPSESNKTIIAIEVEPSRQVIGTTRGRFLRRIIGVDNAPQCQPFTAQEMIDQQVARGAVDHAGLPLPGANLDDLNHEQIALFRDLMERNTYHRGLEERHELLKLSDEALLIALDCLREVGDQLQPTAGALLLFGYEQPIRRYIPTHQLRMDGRNFSQPILELVDLILPELSQRVDLPEFVLNEVIVNALIHRDYSRNEEIEVIVQDEELIVRSPGGVLPGFELSAATATSQPRSTILARATRHAGLQGKPGRGIKYCGNDLAALGLPPPNYSYSTAHYVEVRLQTK